MVATEHPLTELQTQGLLPVIAQLLVLRRVLQQPQLRRVHLHLKDHQPLGPPPIQAELVQPVPDRLLLPPAALSILPAQDPLGHPHRETADLHLQ